MRVTNQSQLFANRKALQYNLQAMDRARADISSGVRIHTMSDDPTNASQLVRVGSSMRALNQFRRNLNLGIAQATAEEGALDHLTSALGRAIELGITQSNATANAQSRLIVKAEVDSLIAHSVNLGNTRLGDDYIFGGNRTGEAPFQNPATVATPFSRLLDAGGGSVNPSGNRQIEIGDNRFITPVHNGTEVLLSTDALESLRALSTALGANNAAGIAAATTRITTAHANVQVVLGAQGARMNEMENQTNTLNLTELSLRSLRSDLRDTEIDEAMTELTGRQTLYQAALSATSRILGLSLANYL